MNKKKLKFGVFSTDSFKCKLRVGCDAAGKFSSFNSNLPKIINAGYRSGLKGKKLGGRYREFSLSASFVGLIPQKVKDKIVALKEAGIKTFIIAETAWKVRELAKPDPLVVAVYDKKVYLVDKFNASIEENYVTKEFSKDPEKEKDN